jgi:hypothetical protein
MTDDNKPPMFGPSFVIDPANHEPRSGKSAHLNQMMAETIIGNCTTTIPLKFDFGGADTGHTVVIGPICKGMSAQ